MKQVFLEVFAFGAFVTLSLLLVSACNIKLGAGANNETKTESYSYELTYNNCTTGKKSFSSKEAYCASLNEDTRSCVAVLAQEKYNTEFK